MLEKPKLISNYKEYIFFTLIFGVFFSIRIWVLYEEYREFISKPFYFTTATVLQEYQKGERKVLKVYSENLDLTFYTTTNRLNLLGKKVRLKLFPSQNISFKGYLNSFYIGSYIVEIYPKRGSFKSKLLRKIEEQHQERSIIEFYQAIFLANPPSKDFRNQISKLGVSHLIALSGFHLAVISSVTFFILNALYTPFQRRYFPYRFNLIDIGFLILLILGWFVWFVNSPPSLIRSYIMMVMGWILLLLGVELISFSFLTLSVMVILLIFPKMLLSLGFWFSVLGVFYIFLILKYFGNFNKYLLTLVIPFAIFLLMSPIVHIFFPLTTKIQLYSPLFSILFIPFYPISIFLHIIGFGNIFDTSLLKLFLLESRVNLVKFPIGYGIGYFLLSILAIYSKWVFYMLFLLIFIYGIPIYYS